MSESRDGAGSADHDEPYEFGRRLSSEALSPFTFRQYARLQIMRGRFEKIDPPVEDTARLVSSTSTPGT